MDPSSWHKDIRLPPEHYLGSRWYFVTLCAFEHKHYFRSKTLADWLLRALRKDCVEHSFLLRAYCLMPNHLHMLLQGSSLNADLLKFIGNFKHKTSRRFSAGSRKALWQTSFYDHILRKPDAPGDVSWYIWMNPVRAGLVTKPEDYPYSGPFSPGPRIGPYSEKPWAPPGVEAKQIKTACKPTSLA